MADIIGAVIAPIVIVVGVVLMYLGRRRAYAATGQGPSARARHLFVIVLAIFIGAIIVARLVWP